MSTNDGLPAEAVDVGRAGPRAPGPSVGSSSPERFLAPLGIGASAEALYAAIVTRGGIPLHELSDHVAEVDELTEGALVHIDDHHVRAVPSHLAVERWVSEQELQIQRARVAASHFAAMQRLHSGHFIEVVRGECHAHQASQQVRLSARGEVLCLERPSVFGSTWEVTSPTPSDAARGVSAKVIYERHALEDPCTLRAVQDAIAHGEEVRTFCDVPMRMMIADATTALLILPVGRNSTGEGPADVDAVVVHPSPFLDSLIELFHALWALSVPLGPHRNPLTDDHHRQMVQLLATGLTDASIARELGVSERTVHRRITRLQASLGVNTRFLLGVQAAKNGWI